MSLCAIIPVKPLLRGKSRLSDILSSKQREILNKFLLKSVLECLDSIEEIDHKIVISYDPSALAFSRKYGANTVLENRNTNINRALRRATLAAKAYSATKLLILPADLPLISTKAIRDMLALEENPPQMIIVPDRKMDGTNALFINPIGEIKYNFGEWSFRKHIEQAERKKINTKIFQNETLSFDLDLPEDWQLLQSMKDRTHIELQNLFQEVTA